MIKPKADLNLRLPLVCLILAILSVMTTSSRMIFAFARYGTFLAWVLLMLTMQGWRSSCVSLFCYCPSDLEIATERSYLDSRRGDHFRVHLLGVDKCLQCNYFRGSCCPRPIVRHANSCELPSRPACSSRQKVEIAQCHWMGSRYGALRKCFNICHQPNLGRLHCHISS